MEKVPNMGEIVSVVMFSAVETERETLFNDHSLLNSTVATIFNNHTEIHFSNDMDYKQG